MTGCGAVFPYHEKSERKGEWKNVDAVVIIPTFIIIITIVTTVSVEEKDH